MGCPRLCWMMLVGDLDPAGVDDLHRSLNSVLPHVGHVFLHANGADGPPFGSTDRITVGEFEWHGDFARARNELFSMIPPGQFDWAGWSDADDELVGGERLEELIASLDSETQCVWLNYVYAWDRQTGNPRVEHWRERLFRLDAPWSWTGAIHENCVGPFGVQNARRDQVHVRHWREDTPEKNLQTRQRNRAIVARQHQLEPEVARWSFLMANEVYAEAQLTEDVRERDALYDAALTEYRRFVVAHPASDDAYMANDRMAEILRAKGLLDQAVNQYLQGLKLRPTWPEAWVGIAETMVQAKEWAIARDFADICIRTCVRPVTVQVWEPTTLEYTPYVFRGIGREETGDLAGAMEDFKHAMTVYPNPGLAERIDTLQARLDRPVVDLKTIRKGLFGSNPTRSIAFVTRRLYEPWHPEIIGKEGSGGAEWCIVEIARRFRADGYRVAVFGTPGDFRGVDSDGIEWWDCEEFLPTENFSIVVSSRAPEVFDNEVNAGLKVLWMHDVNAGPVAESMFGNRFDRCDVVVALSAWHRQHLARQYGIDPRRIEVIPNGYDPELFRMDETVARDPFRMVWASSPDRGLENLLGIWPTIRGAFPEAKLDVFYGWKGIDKLIEAQGDHGAPLQAFKERIVALAEHVGADGSIVWRDRVPRSTLAEHYRSCGIWPYTTSFCETFCITALEMQASGVLPVTSRLAALPERVGRLDLLVPGLAGNTAYRNAWLEVLRRVLEAPPATVEAWRAEQAMRVRPFTWDRAFDQWRRVRDTLLRVA